MLDTLRIRGPLVVVSGGGTGGHLYPALAIADALREVRPDVHITFVGAKRGLEARVLPERAEDHLLLPISGFNRGRAISLFPALVGLLVGLIRVIDFFRRYHPEVVVVTGGYAGAPAGIAAGLMGVPLVLQEQNSVPGIVTKLLTKVATRVHVAYPEVVQRLPLSAGRCVVSGNPVRSRSGLGRNEARHAFGIPEHVTLAFVTGGSQGFSALNEVFTAYVASVSRGDIKRPEELHLLWSTGSGHFAGVVKSFGEREVPRWVHTLPYIEDMPGALVAADLAVSRAGAMTIAEFLNHGLPAVLVPLPTATENHQEHNARALEAAGAARVVPQRELSPSRLAEEIASMAMDPLSLEQMGMRASERAYPRATQEIAGDVTTMLSPIRSAA